MRDEEAPGHDGAPYDPTEIRMKEKENVWREERRIRKQERRWIKVRGYS